MHQSRPMRVNGQIETIPYRSAEGGSEIQACNHPMKDKSHE